MARGRTGTALVAVREAEHRELKAIAARRGMRLGGLVSEVLAAWLEGEVYVCPCGSVAATPPAGERTERTEG